MLRKPPRALSLPRQPFFVTPAERVHLARQRFFDEGDRPSGLVGEDVIQSWSRCLAAHRRPAEPVSFQPLSKSSVSSALARNRVLLEAAHADLAELEHALAGTRCKAILTDGRGVVIRTTRGDAAEGRLMQAASRLGVDLTEEMVGTTAPGVTARTGRPSSVQGGEHFFDSVTVMHCAAAPIRDRHGELAGVLDLSCESQPFRFDAVSLVRLYATAIENRLLRAQSGDHVLLRFQASAALLSTPLEGLAAIDGHGCIAWINAAGASLLDAHPAPGGASSLEAVFGLTLGQVLALAHHARPAMHPVPQGLVLCLQAELRLRDGLAPAAMITVPAEPAVGPAEPPGPAPEQSAASAAATLRDSNRQLIESTLAACGGNLSRTARKLGVSRGLLYRRLREWDASAG